MINFYLAELQKAKIIVDFVKNHNNHKLLTKMKKINKM
jgi:hypothetical protein